LFASEEGNRAYGNSGDDTFILGKSDRLVGDEGADRFFTTSGGDNLITGGADSDRFWIAVAQIPDTANIITDFTSGEDVIGLAGLGIGFEDLNITQDNNNTSIGTSDRDLAVLLNFDAATLSSDHFVFV
jgi:hypothetical protein